MNEVRNSVPVDGGTKQITRDNLNTLRVSERTNMVGIGYGILHSMVKAIADCERDYYDGMRT